MKLKLLPPDPKVWAPRHWLSCALPFTIFIFMLLFYLTGGKRNELTGCGFRAQLCVPERSLTSQIEPGLKSGELHCLGPNKLPGQMISPFRESLTTEGDLQLPQFLDGWRKLVMLLDPLGTLFTFATQEASTKLSVLESYSRGPNSTHYHTFSAMANWEKDPSKLSSGLRTLVLLHRALRWAQLCLGGIARVQNADMGALCRKAYQSVLGPHHPWLIRQAANLAFLAFPRRRQLLAMVCPGATEQEAQEALSQVADTLEAVYNRTQVLLNERGMLAGRVTLKPTGGR
ncbi:glycolipid transfer protein domain-containing protein 2 isoform X2 [Dromiciops gliroides]|uniref:glycolipid transfer protein domain-containing protein 2 isoform X2 n=1 Tax=Dromiciops gliroides TaxID=33562 RepID=UPI001CC7BB03|nr:glycolipid transfer protein domain-containing protein 2 isoform X2 [Dromiciops gliroides]